MKNKSLKGAKKRENTSKEIQPSDSEDITFIYKITKKQMDWLEAYVLNDFHISNTCNQFGISRQTYYQWMSHEEFYNAFQDFKEIVLDNCEKTLMNAAKKGDKDSAKFLLKHLGKKRGYTESLDITTNGNPLTTTIVQIINPKFFNSDGEDQTTHHSI